MVPEDTAAAPLRTTRTIDGTPYVAMRSGWGIDSTSMQTQLTDAFPGHDPDGPEGASVFAAK